VFNAHMVPRAFATTATNALTKHGKPKELNRRIPGYWNLPIASCSRFHMGKRRERVMKALHQHPLGLARMLLPMLGVLSG